MGTPHYGRSGAWLPEDRFGLEAGRGVMVAPTAYVSIQAYLVFALSCRPAVDTHSEYMGSQNGPANGRQDRGNRGGLRTHLPRPTSDVESS